jgi:hypothetical protein
MPFEAMAAPQRAMAGRMKSSATAHSPEGSQIREPDNPRRQSEAEGKLGRVPSICRLIALGVNQSLAPEAATGAY